LFQEDAESQYAGYVGSDRTRLLITTPAFAGIPFEPVPALMAIADEVLKLSAGCIKCGTPAIHTQGRGDSTDRVQVGTVGAYEARCRSCFDPGQAGRRAITEECFPKGGSHASP
jgi:thymidine kinase